MNDAFIGFPNLGISLTHVGKSLSVFGFEIAFYGIVIALAMLAGICSAMQIAKMTGQDPDDYYDFGIIAILVSLVTARLYYVVFNWDYYSRYPLEILNFRGGGLAIYGGVIGGVLTCFVFAKLKKLKPLAMVDTACIGLALGQCIGRWGNFFNREAFGSYTDNLFAMQLPLDAVRLSEVTSEMMEHVVREGGTELIQVHPTFLYESLWNLGTVFLLLFFTFRCRRRFSGQVFTWYLLLYGSGRFWIEGLRTDQLLLPGSGLPVSRVLSLILVVSAAAVQLIACVRNKRNEAR